MEEVGGDDPSPQSPLSKWRNEFSRKFQYYLDRSAPRIVCRWIGTLGAAAIYVLRVYYIHGFYVISYGLGIYILNLLIGFMSPNVDPGLEVLDGGASSPRKDSDEFRPFTRRLPEFKFWWDKILLLNSAFIQVILVSLLQSRNFWDVVYSLYYIFVILVEIVYIQYLNAFIGF